MIETVEQHRVKIGNIIAKEIDNVKNRDEMLKALKKIDDFILEYPYDKNAYANRAYILELLGFYELALNDLQRVAYLDPEDKKCRVIKGQILLKLGKFENGWSLYEWRRGFNPKNNKELPYAEMDKAIGLPYWNGEKLKENEKLFILFEQGFGDNIQFYRFVPYLKDKGIKLVVAFNPILRKLTNYNLKKLGDEVEIQKDDEKMGKNCNYYVFAMSLPYILKMYDSNKIPGKTKYLEIPTEFLKKWKNKLKKTDKKKIGIFWESNSLHDKGRFRNISFEKIKELFNIDVEFHCLQKTLLNDEKNKKWGGGYKNLYFWDDELDDFCDTAAIIDQMDLVITVDTAVAHLAGALGKPTWILISYISDFRWELDRSDSSWYDSVKIFRQKEDYLWERVISEVKEELEKFIK
ncbi:glycosyltransferase family 9 protein [Leptotrichia wadei]|uniref:glycosyltransferase family 9 protein n=1 Tax=Leptotrichia wadei TaxID=157687 RepID=UPI0028E55917|nr:glycosyltransferase family 9 protein [Leptotrichia wadei]